jgi:DNA-binding CsgD family transcriptional regulator
MRASIRNDLVSRVANLQMYGGDPASAIVTLGDPPPSVPEGNDDDLAVRDLLRSRVLWAIPGVPAIALSGRTGEAVAIGFEAFAEHARLGGEVGFSSLGIHLVTLSHALQEHGDFAQARSVATAGYEATLESGALLGQIWFALNLGRIGLLTGHPEVTRRWGREALAATAAMGWLGPRLMTLTGMAGAAALAGDLDEGRRWLDEFEAIGDRFGFLFPERAIGRAWFTVADGRLDDAKAILADAADRAAATGHLTAESWLRYEGVRLGGPKRVMTALSNRLAELAVGSDSALIAARAGAAAAFLADDARALETAGDVWAEMGCDLAASELYTAAAEALRDQGQPRAGQSMALRAQAALDRTGGARSFRPSRLDSIVPLSPREREIAGLAASGVPSKEIAARLYLSVRTVNNHLQNAYTKLGVSSRADVARVLAEGGS